jgi:hypothetical protein
MIWEKGEWSSYKVPQTSFRITPKEYIYWRV